MKLAYFIMAHHKPNMLLRLIRAIYSPDNIYLIHIDRKADESVYETAAALCRGCSNIHMFSSGTMTWAAWSLVQAEIDGIRKLMQLDADWTHYINLSGQDFPLVSQSQIHRVLQDRTGGNFVRLSDYTTLSVPIEKRKILFNQYYVEDVGQLKSLGKRDSFESYFADDILPYTGSQWKILSRDFCNYAVHFSLALDMQDYFRYTFIPDESYFPTLLMNSPFAESLVNENYRFQIMTRSAEVFARPVTLTKGHLKYIAGSNALFARKFDEEIDSDIIHIIERSITGGNEG